MEGLIPRIMQPNFAYASTSSSHVQQQLYNNIINGYIKKYLKHYFDNNDYFNSFPPGYRFNPTEEELIIFYLMKKVRNEPLPPNQISEVDVYQQDPEIVYMYKRGGEKEWYFFSPRERKYANGERPKRTTRDGYWKVSGSDKVIRSKGRVVGRWNTLVYYRGKAPRGAKTNWIMREYRLAQHSHKRTSNIDMMLDDFVLCKIYKKAEANANSKSKRMVKELKEEGFEEEGSDITKMPQYPRNGYDDQSYSTIINPSNNNYKYGDPSSCSGFPGHHHHHHQFHHSQCQDLQLSDHNYSKSPSNYLEDTSQTFSENETEEFLKMLEVFNNNDDIGPYSLEDLIGHDL